MIMVRFRAEHPCDEKVYQHKHNRLELLMPTAPRLDQARCAVQRSRSNFKKVSHVILLFGKEEV